MGSELLNKLWCPKRQIYSRGNSADRDSWLLARRDHLTASDLASVIGVGYRRRSEVLAEKLDPDAGKEDKIHGVPQVEAGRYYEPGIIRWFADQHIGKTEECGELLYRKGAHEFLAATCDALYDGDPLEVKNVDADSQWNWGQHTTPRDGWPKGLPFPVPVSCEGTWALKTNKVAAKWKGTPVGEWREYCVKRSELLPLLGPPCAPLKFVIQLYAQLYVLKRTEGIICAGIGGTSRLDCYYTVHDDTMSWLLDQADTFWQDVNNRRL